MADKKEVKKTVAAKPAAPAKKVEAAKPAAPVVKPTENKPAAPAAKPTENKTTTPSGPAGKPAAKPGERPAFNRNAPRGNARGGRRGGFQRVPSEFEEKVISIRRVVKVVKGGRRFRFSALVVIGNKKGKVGYGFGKSNEVPDAIKKAIKDAKKNLVEINIIKGADTVPCDWIGKHDSSRVLLKPAKEGTGLIASESVRSVLELSGIRNVYTKSLGSNTPQNVIIATLEGLQKMRTREEVMELRDLKEL